jgi:epoxide hydrolase-like predicted phosphatase
MDVDELVDPSFLAKCRELDIGNLSEDSFVEYLLRFKNTITKEELQKEVDANLKFNIPLAEVIRKLRTNGFKIVLLSNAGNDFFQRKVYVDFPEFKSLFDEIIISSTVQMVKPDRNIYEYTLKKIGSKPEESIFIDDRKINVDAAEDLGIRGYVYTDVDSFVKYLEVNKFL